MASAKRYLIITGAYVKVATFLMRALFCLKVSYVQEAFKKKNFFALNVHQTIILENSISCLFNFAVVTIYVFHFSSEVLIQFMGNTGLSICGVA